MFPNIIFVQFNNINNPITHLVNVFKYLLYYIFYRNNERLVILDDAYANIGQL